MIREFDKYKYLGVATARKYYSHYFVKWEEDVLQTAYLGVYRALKDADITKINNEVSFNAYVVLKVRGEIMKWEKSLFGSIGSKRREVEYNMLSLDYSLHDSEADERITICQSPRNRSPVSSHITPFSASTMGYWAVSLTPQARHLPF